MDGWNNGIDQQENATGNLDNYQPITLIRIIYKLWATITSDRLNPLLNLLTKDSIYEYKSKKSTIDVTPMTNTQVKNSNEQQMILFDFAKAFGSIERGNLWTRLYEAGVPSEFAQFPKMGHEGNKLRPKGD